MTDEITLHQLPPAWGLPSLSHFCVKVGTYLRMAGIPYRTATAAPMQAPKGKIPWIDDGGTVVADSGAIVEHLEATRGAPLDGRLLPLDRAHGLALRRMIEEHTYFAVLWLRWTGEASWPYVREYIESLVPVEMDASEISGQARAQILESIRQQGVGRHTSDEVLDRVRADLSALSAILGERAYFLGDAPTSVDCALYGVLAQVLWPPWDAPDKRHLESLGNLVAFCERIRSRYWVEGG